MMDGEDAANVIKFENSCTRQCGPMAKKKKSSRKKAVGKSAVKKKTAAKKKTAKKKTAKSTKAKASRKTAKKKKPAKAAKKTSKRNKRKAGATPKLEVSAPLVADDDGWIEADGGYSLSIRNGKLACRNAKGKVLASVPKKVKDSELGEQLSAMAAWLKARQEELSQQVQTWMLRSLPIPLKAAVEVWADSDWKNVLENLVVAPVDKSGEPDVSRAGILRDVDLKKGLGVVDEDGETGWIKTGMFVVPHPVLLENVNDLRDLLVDLEFKQSAEQLFRDVHAAEKKESDKLAIKRFSNGVFEQLNFANSACRTLGYPVSGGSAVCTIWENGKPIEARYWIGADYPEGETWTGDLTFVDDQQQTLKISEVGPVAISEGIRMAAAIYARRKVPKEVDGAV